MKTFVQDFDAKFVTTGTEIIESVYKKPLLTATLLPLQFFWLKIAVIT